MCFLWYGFVFVITHSQWERIWFWYETVPAPGPTTAPADAKYLRIRKQSKHSAYSYHSKPFFPIVWTLILISVMVLNLKNLNFKKNLVTTVQDERLNEMI